MSPLQEPRNPEPQSPPCTGLHLSTVPALALGGHPCSLGSTARTAGQDRDSLLVAREAHTHSHPASSCKAETGQEAWNPQLSRWPECNMPLPNQTRKMHSLHKAASVSASQQAQPSPWLHHLLSTYRIQNTLGKSSKSMITFPLSPRSSPHRIENETPVFKRPASELRPRSWARLSVHTSLPPLLADPFPEAFRCLSPGPACTSPHVTGAVKRQRPRGPQGRMWPACLSPSLGLGPEAAGCFVPNREKLLKEKKKEAEINSRKKVNDHVAPGSSHP